MKENNTLKIMEQHQQHRDIKHVTQNTTCVAEKVEKTEEESGREKLKRHRVEVAGNVWIPEIWGQEQFLKDWVDCTTAFDASLVHSRITTAQKALVQEGSKVNNLIA